MIRNRYCRSLEYDHQNRVRKHRHYVGNNPGELLAENTYRKLFGYEMKYQTPTTSSITGGRYNGNILTIDWKNSNDGVLKRYDYNYDGLNRLTMAHYREPMTSVPQNHFYSEEAAYDLNGNIINLWRNAKNPSGGYEGIDILTYQYSGNQLTSVTDATMNPSGYEGGGNTIDYDLNGNMINMKDKGIQSIAYNYLSLPDSYSITQQDPFGTSVNFGLSYLYRADGTKLRKTYTRGGGKGQPVTNIITDYLDGFHYNFSETVVPCDWCRTSVAFEQRAFGEITPGPFPVTAEWKLDFVPTSEGFYSFTENRYIYQYRDHLGNARVSFTKDSEGILTITDTNDYYPFGLNHVGGIKGLLGGYQNYKYNGKELQETGMYDYGARFYMPDIGRWGVVDPASEHVPEFSPYTFTFNDPIGFVDNDGEFPGPTGAVIGILADYIGQVAGHYFFDNMSFKNSMIKDINYWSLGISGVTGALTGGIDSFKNTLTSGVGKKIFVNMIDYGVDVLVNTVGGVLADQLDEGEFDVWKSLTGGLIEAGVGRVIPLKYVDKLEKKLLHKMGVNANKAAKIKSKLGNVTRKKTIRKLEAKLQVAESNVINYTSAYTGVKTVNDVFKKTGVNGLTDQLFKKEESPKKEGKLTIGEVISEGRPNQ